MKKIGILNKPLSSEIAGMGHTDRMMICDAGFPIPKDIQRIDLALVHGIPSFMQVLNAVLKEMVVEEIIIAQETQNTSPELFSEIKTLLPNQKLDLVPQEEFLKLSKDAKCIVRTAELTPYANIILVAASGVDKYKKGFDVVVTDK